VLVLLEKGVEFIPSLPLLGRSLYSKDNRGDPGEWRVVGQQWFFLYPFLYPSNWQVVATLGVEAEDPCVGNQCGQQGRTSR
jgi:hypothetical protein